MIEIGCRMAAFGVGEIFDVDFVSDTRCDTLLRSHSVNSLCLRASRPSKVTILESRSKDGIIDGMYHTNEDRV